MYRSTVFWTRFARIPAHDRTHGRVGFHGRGVDAKAFADYQAGLGQCLQHPSEYFLMDFQGQTLPDSAQAGVIRYPLGQGESQKLSQRQGVGTSPLKPALALNTFEIANQVHPEISTWRNGFPARTGRIIRFTKLLDKAVKAALDQDRLQAVIKNVSRRAR
jgi:hypothetical protein